MDFEGQKQAEQLCLYIIVTAGILAFGAGWLDANFALMMKVLSRLMSPVYPVACHADLMQCLSLSFIHSISLLTFTGQYETYGHCVSNLGSDRPCCSLTRDCFISSLAITETNILRLNWTLKSAPQWIHQPFGRLSLFHCAASSLVHRIRKTRTKDYSLALSSCAKDCSFVSSSRLSMCSTTELEAAYCLGYTLIDV